VARIVLQGLGTRMATFDGIPAIRLAWSASWLLARRCHKPLARYCLSLGRARLRLVLSSAAAFPPRCGQRHLWFLCNSLPRLDREMDLLHAECIGVCAACALCEEGAGSCRHMHSIVRIRLPPALDEEDWRVHQR